jgi:hypothetical protein
MAGLYSAVLGAVTFGIAGGTDSRTVVPAVPAGKVYVIRSILVNVNGSGVGGSVLMFIESTIGPAVTNYLYVLQPPKQIPPTTVELIDTRIVMTQGDLVIIQTSSPVTSVGVHVRISGYVLTAP